MDRQVQIKVIIKFNQSLACRAGEKLEHCSLTWLSESAGSVLSIKKTNMLRSGAKDASQKTKQINIRNYSHQCDI